MGLVYNILANGLHPAPPALAVGFSLLLVTWLVVAEEVELRRRREFGSELTLPAAVAGTARMSSGTV